MKIKILEEKPPSRPTEKSLSRRHKDTKEGKEKDERRI